MPRGALPDFVVFLLHMCIPCCKTLLSVLAFFYPVTLTVAYDLILKTNEKHFPMFISSQVTKVVGVGTSPAKQTK